MFLFNDLCDEGDLNFELVLGKQIVCWLSMVMWVVIFRIRPVLCLIMKYFAQ